MALRGFITNLGKYNEGELIGEWIDFPISDEELEKVKERIGIDDNYEEWFFTDYDCDLDGFYAGSLGEYESIDHLNEIGEAIEQAEEEGVEDAVGAGLEEGFDFLDAVQKAIDGDILRIDDLYSDMPNTDEAIGYYYVDAVGGPEELDKEDIERYVDFEALGRDVRLEYSPMDEEDPETAGEYWCGDEDASDEEIGEAVLDNIGIDGIANKEYYFDYESYGRDIRLEGHFVRTDSGLFEIID